MHSSVYAELAVRCSNSPKHQGSTNKTFCDKARSQCVLDQKIVAVCAAVQLLNAEDALMLVAI